MTWQQRQAALGEALGTLHEVQRAAGLPTGPAVVEPFFNGPFAGLSGSVTELLLTEVNDPLLRRMPAGVGSVEQWVENGDVLSVPQRRVAVAQAWRSIIRAPDTETQG